MVNFVLARQYFDRGVAAAQRSFGSLLRGHAQYAAAVALNAPVPPDSSYEFSRHWTMLHSGSRFLCLGSGALAAAVFAKKVGALDMPLRAVAVAGLILLTVDLHTVEVPLRALSHHTELLHRNHAQEIFIGTQRNETAAELQTRTKAVLRHAKPELFRAGVELERAVASTFFLRYILGRSPFFRPIAIEKSRIMTQLGRSVDAATANVRAPAFAAARRWGVGNQELQRMIATLHTYAQTSTVVPLTRILAATIRPDLREPVRRHDILMNAYDRGRDILGAAHGAGRDISRRLQVRPASEAAGRIVERTVAEATPYELEAFVRETDHRFATAFNRTFIQQQRNNEEIARITRNLHRLSDERAAFIDNFRRDCAAPEAAAAVPNPEAPSFSEVMGLIFAWTKGAALDPRTTVSNLARALLRGEGI